jgi:tetratricopeptide (TPR) repeat protein
MSRLFLSHAGENNAEAAALRGWLKDEGWDDVFLDFDRTHGIAPGERWAQALDEAIRRCEAVIFLLSRSWLTSSYCAEELNSARSLKKQLFGVLIDDLAIEAFPMGLIGTWQVARLAPVGDQDPRALLSLPERQEPVSFSADGLARLRIGLKKAGLDPRFFDWPPKTDPDRSPYPGMRPLEGEDAGIFFGRDAPTIDALDTLRRLRQSAAPRFFVIIGASGAGKSSFLRAGLIPRLQRDERHFLALPALRPERAAISGSNGFMAALATVLRKHGIEAEPETIQKAIEGGKQTLLPLLGQLANAAQPQAVDGRIQEIPSTLVVSIDQGEELFDGDGAAESNTLLALCRDMLKSAAPQIIVLCTIRSDRYEHLQRAPIFENVDHTLMSLPLMPLGAYQTVIEGPVERVKTAGRKLKIQPGLTQRLLEDIQKGGGDVLPLLALTLQQLYLAYGSGGMLKLTDYEGKPFGGILGAIERTTVQALEAIDNDPKIPGNRKEHLVRLRRGFIPWLAGIDSLTGHPRRRVATMSEIPDEARPLIQHFVEHRLLFTYGVPRRVGDSQRRETKIEVAHEALLRQWSELRTWLEQDSAALKALDEVKRAADEWVNHARREDLLLHAEGRLDDAEAAAGREDLSGHLMKQDCEYLKACRDQVKKRQAREEKIRIDHVKRVTGDRERIFWHLRESQFGQAKIELKNLVDYIAGQAESELSDRPHYQKLHHQVHRLADFYDAAIGVYSRAGEENFPGAMETCEKGLRSLGILDNAGVFDDKEWWEQLPTDELSSEQVQALRREIYRQLLLYSALLLVPGIASLFPRTPGPPRSGSLFDPIKKFFPLFLISKVIRIAGPWVLPRRQDNPVALAGFRKSRQTLDQVRRIEELWRDALAPSQVERNRHGETLRHSLSSQFVDRIAEMLAEFAVGPKGARIDYNRLLTAPAQTQSSVRPEPINAADYFFIGLLNYFVAKRRAESPVPQIMSLLGQLFPYVDGRTPYATAERLLRAAISLEPRSYWPHWVLGRTLLSAGDVSGAELGFNTAVALQPNYARGYEQRALAIGEQWVRARDPGLRQRAHADSDEAMHVADGDPSIFWPRGELLKLFGEEEKALDAYARWLEYEEDLMALIARIGSVTQLYEFTQTVLRDKAATRARSLRANASAVLSWVYIVWKYDDLALQAAEDALRIDSQQAHALVAKGVVLILRDRFDEAAKALTSAQEHDPSNCRAVFELARLYDRNGQTDAAVKAWERLLAMYRPGATPRCPAWMAREGEARLEEATPQSSDKRACADEMPLLIG